MLVLNQLLGRENRRKGKEIENVTQCWRRGSKGNTFCQWMCTLQLRPFLSSRLPPHPCGFPAVIAFLLGPPAAHDMLGLQALGSLGLDPETLSLSLPSVWRKCSRAQAIRIVAKPSEVCIGGVGRVRVQLSLSLAMKPWASCSSSPHLGFLICEVGTITVAYFSLRCEGYSVKCEVPCLVEKMLHK